MSSSTISGLRSCSPSCFFQQRFVNEQASGRFTLKSLAHPRVVPVSPAVEVEDRYRAVLKDNRARDAAAHRTLDGPHLSDLAVTHAEKQIAAADASTGEQKALLIGLVLAHAGLLAEMSGLAPVLLLDEVVAHLDPARRSALYAELDALGAQAWMTGADAAVFAEIEGKAEVFEVLPGEVKRT